MFNTQEKEGQGLNIKLCFSGRIYQIRVRLCAVVMAIGLLLMVCGIAQAIITKELFINFWYLLIGFLIVLAGSCIENKDKKSRL